MEPPFCGSCRLWRQIRLSGAEEAETAKVRTRGARAHARTLTRSDADNGADSSSRESSLRSSSRFQTPRGLTLAIGHAVLTPA